MTFKILDKNVLIDVRIESHHFILYQEVDIISSVLVHITEQIWSVSPSMAKNRVTFQEALQDCSINSINW